MELEEQEHTAESHAAFTAAIAVADAADAADAAARAAARDADRARAPSPRSAGGLSQPARLHGRNLHTRLASGPTSTGSRPPPRGIADNVHSLAHPVVL